jgi:hypothetical protein
MIGPMVIEILNGGQENGETPILPLLEKSPIQRELALTFRGVLK